jgi:hypothetical protein
MMSFGQFPQLRPEGAEIMSLPHITHGSNLRIHGRDGPLKRIAGAVNDLFEQELSIENLPVAPVELV